MTVGARHPEERFGSYVFEPRLVENLRQELDELGLLAPLADPELTDLMVNESGSVYAASLGGLRRLPLDIDPTRLESAIASLASLHSRQVGAEHPILEATLPFHHARALALVPPVVPRASLTLRKPPARLLPLEELVERGTLTSTQAEELTEAVITKKTVVVAGGTGSGKTTLASALLDALLKKHPEERLVILEEGARELQVEGRNVNRLLAAPGAGVDLHALVRAALRMNPDRIILGEARGAEALDFLKACNTGHPGGLLTLHANSAREALVRLDALVQEAGVPSQMERIREVVEVVVFMERAGIGRRVGEVASRRDGFRDLQTSSELS